MISYSCTVVFIHVTRYTLVYNVPHAIGANEYLQINNVHVRDCSCPSRFLGAKVWETNMEKIGGGCGGPCGRQQPCFGPKNSKRPPWCVPIQNDCTERNGEEEKF